MRYVDKNIIIIKFLYHDIYIIDGKPYITIEADMDNRYIACDECILSSNQCLRTMRSEDGKEISNILCNLIRLSLNRPNYYINKFIPTEFPSSMSVYLSKFLLHKSIELKLLSIDHD